ncbi:hypothetical protein [Microcystis aeruginosa]|jgi:hypothetical protein|uniref:hypothetical protein n=1 Tax=Microcystis aeruginosa TaxID=1126 RepID=UPI0029318355|nr:hypothetical protein [Microcystis aeruginosa]WOB70825.1 hypothetical protein PJW00_16810 [Microcystis aeruginosa LE3]
MMQSLRPGFGRFSFRSTPSRGEIYLRIHFTHQIQESHESGEIENLEILFFSKRLESQTQFELLLEENLKMTEPLTAGLLITLAVQEFVKSGTGDLAKRFTAEALAKIPVLWEKIKTRLIGKSTRVDEALAKVERGDSTAVETLTKNLDVILDEDPAFAKELKVLAQTIQAGKIQDNSSMIQNIADNAKGWQTKVEGGTAYIGRIHLANIGSK